MNARIYLDNAATSWPKPPEVYDAVDHYARENGAPAGRGAYAEANEVERIIADTRRRAAEWMGGGPASQIVFTLNGTDSLNLALHGYLRPGDHVVTTLLEHNSVLRPLRTLEQTLGVRVTYLPTGKDTVLDPDQVRSAVGPDTRMLALTHMSNVTGAIQPVKELCTWAAERDLACLIDAAQSVGHHPIDFAAPTTLIACPGHKGLLGPLGVGLLRVPAALEGELQPVRQGGTGTRSESDLQPDSSPDRYESGNHNVPAIVGLGAGLKWLDDFGLERIEQQLGELRRTLREGLDAIEGVQCYGPTEPNAAGAVLAFRVDGFSAQEVAAMLDSAHRIQVRAGYLCAPRIHEILETQDGGVVRFSPGLFNTQEQVAQVVDAVAEIASVAF